MLYLYDNAIVDDLKQSFNPGMSGSPVVKAVDDEGLIAIAAQIQNDEITFPIVAVVRGDYKIDTNRTNFTLMHKGVAKVFDNETNMLYYEKAIPIELGYTLTVLTTNSADMDELVRELIFKYTSMYFLSIRLPYESDRIMRFGIRLNTDAEIERESGTAEYLQNGRIYQTLIPLSLDGAMLFHYTPAKLTNFEAGICINE